MLTAISVNHVLIRLTDERIGHIISNHPEVSSKITWIVETIGLPDLILEGNFSERIALKMYQKTPVSQSKYMAVVYKEENDHDGFVLTAYFCSSYNKRRKVLWKP
jgi:hypothetical protein